MTAVRNDNSFAPQSPKPCEANGLAHTQFWSAVYPERFARTAARRRFRSVRAATRVTRPSPNPSWL